MGRTFAPQETRGFTGLDFRLDPTKIGIRGLVRAVNVRVDRSDTIRRVHEFGKGVKLSNGLTTSDVVGHINISGPAGRRTLALIARGSSGSFALSVHDPNKIRLGESGANDSWLGTGLVGGPGADKRVFTAELNESIYIAFSDRLIKVPLDIAYGLKFGSLSNVKAELGDEDENLSQEIKVKGVTAYNGHLIGWGFGDNSSHYEQETMRLGADRPEMIRWSGLGDPDTWRCEDWIVIGSRDIPIMTCLTAFGRLLVLKSTGAFILYGNLETNSPLVEEMEADDSVPTDCLSQWGATVYDDAAYWMSTNGPLRWSGDSRAVNIGRPIKGEWEDLDVDNVRVHAVPDYKCVGFSFPSSGSHKTFLWDTNAQRWAGTIETDTDVAYVGLVKDREEYFTTFFRSYADGIYASARSPSITQYGMFETGTVVVPGQRGGYPRSVVLAGDWSVVSDGNQVEAIVTGPDGDSPLEVVRVLNSFPGSPKIGDLVYKRVASGGIEPGIFEWNGREWMNKVVSPGLIHIDHAWENNPRREFGIKVRNIRWHPKVRLFAAGIEYID